jgi:hypothetical protein
MTVGGRSDELGSRRPNATWVSTDAGHETVHLGFLEIVQKNPRGSRGHRLSAALVSGAIST